MLQKLLSIFKKIAALLRELFSPTAAPAPNHKQHKPSPVYHYRHKQHMMTAAEADFMKVLLAAVGDQYHVFPQVHLSTVIDHTIEGQTWKYALGHINSKSVDFVISDTEEFRPLVAIELDDKTHEWKERRLRDEEVQRIFTEAKLPLIRFSSAQSQDTASVQQRIIAAIDIH